MAWAKLFLSLFSFFPVSSFLSTLPSSLLFTASYSPSPFLSLFFIALFSSLPFSISSSLFLFPPPLFELSPSLSRPSFCALIATNRWSGPIKIYPRYSIYRRIILKTAWFTVNLLTNRCTIPIMDNASEWAFLRVKDMRRREERERKRGKENNKKKKKERSL